MSDELHLTLRRNRFFLESDAIHHSSISSACATANCSCSPAMAEIKTLQSNKQNYPGIGIILLSQGGSYYIFALLEREIIQDPS